MKTHIRVPLFLSLARAAPIAQVFRQLVSATLNHGEPGELIREPEEPSNDMFFMIMFSIALVLLGGVFAGLTIGLMGQDEVYLQVISESGEARERKHARKVLNLLSKGKHWVLVTLLLSNVITNETLPIVLDSFLGGGWPAVVGSTAAIVIFGEIIPQSICVRYGLALGAFFSPYVLALMYLMYPIAYPIAKLLDYILGEDHGTVYKKAGLKTLVTLHRTMGVERLNEDEVTIISAVLDLKDKPIGKIMTPIKDVFVLASDTILDEAMVEKILLTGFNRIPIHAPRQPQNFIGMLLVRILITYDPEDCLPISNFALATLPETHPETSCLNILNYFQEGKSHMVCVSTNPGDVHGAIGVVTLEDVIEELIGEEIVDESDVFVDVQKAIRRQTPAPMRGLMSSVSRFSSPGAKLIPSNRASNPKTTNNSKITIKQGRPSSSLPASRTASRSVSRDGSRAGTPAAINGDIMTENEAMEVNMDASNNNNLSSGSAQIPVRFGSGGGPNQHLEDAGIAVGTFTENVVRVGGFNKVIIKDSETASRSSDIGSSSVGSSDSV